jgi:hypothetical protein
MKRLFIGDNLKLLFPLFRHSSKNLYKTNLFFKFSTSIHNRVNPKKEKFYGVPEKMSIPRSGEEFLKKIKYLHNTNDLIDLLNECKEFLTGEELGVYLNRLNYILNKEMSTSLMKHKEQKFILRPESDIHREYEQKKDELLSLIFKICSSEKNIYNIKNLLNCYFEIYHKFKRSLPKEVVETLFNTEMVSKDIGNLSISDLTKLSYLYSQYFQHIEVSRDKAISSFALIKTQILPLLSKLDQEEIYRIIINFGLKEIYPDFELFTFMEPYILKYLNSYDMSKVIRIFTTYIKNKLGSNFFIQTLSFSIYSHLSQCQVKDLINLLEISKEKYYNTRESEIDFKFKEIFVLGERSIFQCFIPFVNHLTAKQNQIILQSFRNLCYVDEKLIRLVATRILSSMERMNFEEFITTSDNFLFCNYQSDIFWKKVFDILWLNLLCLKNYTLGFDDFENLQGLYEQNLLRTMERIYSKNTESFKLQLLTNESNAMTERSLKTFHIFAKMLNVLLSNLQKFNSIDNSNLEIINNSIDVLNYYSNSLFKSRKTFNVLQSSLQSFYLASFYFEKLLQKNGKDHKKKQHKILNLDFIKSAQVIINISKDLKFIKFKNDIIEILKKNYNFTIAEKLSEKNFTIYLNPDLLFETTNTPDLSTENSNSGFVFINDPTEYITNLQQSSGINKTRKYILKSLNVKFIEIDYYEFFLFLHLNQIPLDKSEDKEVLLEFLKSLIK